MKIQKGLPAQAGVSTLIGIIIIVITSAVFFGGVFTYQYFSTEIQPITQNQPQLIGGDKDSHGCLIAAGYSWCETKQKCLRIWEESCEVVTKEQSCLNSGGTVSTQDCFCSGTQDFYNNCEKGACACNPARGYNKEVKVCDCGQGKCFDGEKCVAFSF